MKIIQVTLLVALPLLMFAQGMGIDVGDLAFLRKRPGLFLRSLLAVDVLVPLATLCVVLLIKPPFEVGVGLAVLAASPVAPFVLPKMLKVAESARYAASLHVSLAALSIVTTPLTLALLAEVLGFEAAVRPLAIAERVASTLLVPLGLGVAIRSLRRGFAEKVEKPLTTVAGLLLAAVVTLLLVVTGRVLLSVSVRSYAAMAVMSVSALGIGHGFAGRDPAERTTLALECAVRNPVLATLIASLNFQDDKAVPVLIPYLVISALISGVYARRRRKAAASGR